MSINEAFTNWLDGLKAGLRSYTEAISGPLNAASNFWFGLVLIGLVFILLMLYNILRRGGYGAANLKQTKTMAVCSLLIALNVVLGYFTIPINPYMRVGFGFFTSPMAATLYGPMASCVVSILSDVIKFILKPTGAYLPVYTISVGICGMLYGMILYRKKITLLRVFCACLVVSVLGNMILGSIALAPTMAKGLVVMLPGRIMKDLLMLPIHTVVLYFVLKVTKKIV